MTTGEPAPADNDRGNGESEGEGDDDIPRWQVVASRPDYSQRGPQGRFAAVEAAERRAEELRGLGFRDVQVEPLPDDDNPLT